VRARAALGAGAAALGLLAALLLLAGPAQAHPLSQDNARFVQGSEGAAIAPFLYLGAKHMITGSDHILFLFGVIFFLHRLRDVLLYVSLFTLGHSATLLAGVLGGLRVDAHAVDAVIGLSVAYKAFENLGGLEPLRGWRPDTRHAVLVFGLVHGLGLATRLQEFALAPRGLVANLLCFNAGVVIGQVLALTALLGALHTWRAHESFLRHAFSVNSALLCAGFVLTGQQAVGYWVSG
jgi:hypothetical protein